MKIILDSNIVIYSLQPKNEKFINWLEGHTICISAITRLEVLGYHKISQKEIAFAQRYFSACEEVSIQSSIIEEAINLRQLKSMSLGDAIIAATARIHKLTLMTANSKDFKHIENLELINPLKNQ